MRMIKDNIVLFFRTRLVSILVVGFAVASTAYLINGYFRYDQILDVSSIVNPLRRVLSLSIYVFVVFLIVAYEFFSKSRRVHLDETLSATPVGRAGLFLSKFLVLTVCGFIMSGIDFLYGVCAFFAVDFEAPKWPYCLHIAACIFVYTFLVSLCAISLGAAISFIQKRLAALAVVLLSILLVSPLVGAIATTAMLTSDVNVFPMMNFFNILPINLGFMPNFSMGFVVPPDKVSILVFWICAMLSICLWQLYGRYRRAIACIGTAVCILALIGHVLPLSTVRMNDDPNGTVAHDQYYYRANLGKDSPADYQITAYDMELKVGRILRAKVEMSFDKKRDSYDMTLYHGYEVTAARDQSGAVLAFRREGDYVTIDCGAATEKIIVVYRGYSPRYYANAQGTYLPGYFAYYPRVGFIDMANDEHTDIRQVFSECKSKFSITVSSGQAVFSNIAAVAENTFRGETDGVTLYSGFLKEASSDSLRLVYPYLYDECTRGNIDQIFATLRGNGIRDCTFFITPNLNENWEGTRLDNQILSRSVAFSMDNLENREVEGGIK